MFTTILGNELAQNSNGTEMKIRPRERTTCLRGSIFVTGTFGGATAKVRAKVTGVSYVDLPVTLTAEGLIPVNLNCEQIQALASGGDGTTELTFTFLHDQELQAVED